MSLESRERRPRRHRIRRAFRAAGLAVAIVGIGAEAASGAIAIKTMNTPEIPSDGELNAQANLALGGIFAMDVGGVVFVAANRQLPKTKSPKREVAVA